jgi:tetratricopeptide (TPR) repeat protein
MANQDDYIKHMQNGDDAAWQQNWGSAAEHYTRAIQVVPDDAQAHINLGFALLNNGQLDRALKVYRRAIQLAPDDPEPLERSADVLERMGQLKEAAQQYVKVSEVYLQMKDLDKAISIWEHATALTPGLVAVHARLAQAYERIGDKGKSIREYLVLAYNFRRLNEVEKAIRAVDRALKLDPKNALALNTLRSLNAGGEVILPDSVLNRGSKTKEAPKEEFGGGMFWSPEPVQTTINMESHPLGPLGEAIEQGLNLLGQHVFEIGLDPSAMPALAAMESQRQESFEDAIDQYRQAEQAGMRHPALKMGLGGLLILTDHYTDAIKNLGETLTIPALMSGGYHGLAICYHAMGEYLRSGRYLVQCMQNLSNELETQSDRLEDASNVYVTMMSLLDSRTKEVQKQLSEHFLELLQGKDWKVRLIETNTHLSETLRRDGPEGMIDIIVTGGGGGLPETVSTIDRYMRQGLYTLAIDEAHRAIETSPYYLPVHIRMAEILMKEGRIRQAINKYNTIAKAYMVRDENDRAAAILTDVLRMAPLDVDVRMNLINLLESEQRWNDCITQYLDLASTYQQLGDFEKSSQTFATAERLARRTQAPPQRIAEIKHFVADINQMRLNTRQAQKVFEEILDIVPDDEKALKNLVDIYYSQNNQVEAIKRLDTLLGIYAKKGVVNKITTLLKDLVNSNPSDMPLRSRLASIYRKLGDTRSAIEQLDALGELQLEAGMNKEAANTIKQIIGMNPERVEEYRKLLSQLSML